MHGGMAKRRDLEKWRQLSEKRQRSKEEEAQLYFARSFGYVMTAKRDGVMTVKNQ